MRRPRHIESLAGARLSIAGHAWRYTAKTRYFVGAGVLECQLRGYQVLDKWLKDRKKRILNLDDIKHYCRVVTALARTIEIQAEIDQLYPQVEKDLVAV